MCGAQNFSVICFTSLLISSESRHHKYSVVVVTGQCVCWTPNKRPFLPARVKSTLRLRRSRMLMSGTTKQDGSCHVSGCEVNLTCLGKVSEKVFPKKRCENTDKREIRKGHTVLPTTTAGETNEMRQDEDVYSSSNPR